LIGSVHDPIYQGAGPLGIAGIPQPKPGAVTKAHGGILFIDEIGELHPIQMNKLLKVLEDRKVFFESAYYSSEDPNIPAHIQDIFEHGLPADFRLVGATTRQPHEIPAAIRSRCLEVFFRPLRADEVTLIARNAAKNLRVELEDGASDVVARYCTNGREAVNMVQLAAGVAITEHRDTVTKGDLEWVAASGQYAPRMERRPPPAPSVGVVNGLAVYGPNLATLVDIEAVCRPVSAGLGRVVVTGLVQEEELALPGRTLRRKSMAASAVENVVTLLLSPAWRQEDHDWYVHVNFPGGVPVDGPSAGVAVATAVYSAMVDHPVDNRLAMTGEVTIRGEVRGVGGVAPKIEAARLAGCRRVLIPRDNWQDTFRDAGIEVIPVRHLREVLALAVVDSEQVGRPAPDDAAVFSAQPGTHTAP
jgi:Lon-like ATP-dependent protease